MNKYAVVICIEGSFVISSEWDSKESAFSAFHSLCSTLYKDTSTAGKRVMVKVLDSNLDTCEGKMEFIDRSGENAQPAEAAEE